MVIHNEDIKEVLLEVPKGHRHLRLTIYLQGGEEITLQEATVANIVRAYVTTKTHPVRRSIRLVGRKVEEREKKEGYADWQLLEE